MSMDIDAYYCINLYEREDRRQQTKIVFDRYNLPVEFYHVNKDKTDPVRGCFNSHIAVINDAYSRGKQTIMIFEDDIECNLSIEEFRSRMELIGQLLANNDYNIFFLGSTPLVYDEPSTRRDKNIYRVSALNAHSYILSKKGIEKYKDIVYEGIPIDVVYSQDNEAYAYYPSIFNQSSSSSDISPLVPKVSELKKSVNKFKEFYAMRVGIPMKIFLMIAFIMCLVILLITRNIMFGIVGGMLLVYYVAQDSLS